MFIITLGDIYSFTTIDGNFTWEETAAWAFSEYHSPLKGGILINEVQNAVDQILSSKIHKCM